MGDNQENVQQKPWARFHPLRILILCGVEGLRIASLLAIAGGALGIFNLMSQGSLGTDGWGLPNIADLSFGTVAKLFGIAFLAGCLIGIRKI